MSENLELRAKWLNREESLSECAARVSKLLQRLGSIDSAFARWFRLLDTKGPDDSLQHPVSTDPSSLSHEFWRISPDSKIGDPSGDLGFGLRLWNGSKSAEVTFSISIGAAVPNFPSFPNDVNIELPTESSIGTRVRETKELQRILETVVKSLAPDICWISSRQMSCAAFPKQFAGIRPFGWFTYLSEKFQGLPPLPEKYSIRQPPCGGTLVTINDVDFLTTANPAHVEAVAELARLLSGSLCNLLNASMSGVSKLGPLFSS